ncbi:tat pathway signal sequence [Seiridium cupressi]
MSTSFSGAKNGAAQNGPVTNTHTVTALGRWSILNKQLPPVDEIKAIHVYDFDNTLFKTPLPNPKLWNGQTLGSLASPDIFINGGWWHDSRILAATGDGVEREEPRAWEGWWNEKIAELVKLSMQQKDALAVMLTGRSERGFTDLLKRIVASKGLDFDMIGLKPAVGPCNERFTSTMNFKQIFLESLMETYKHAEEIRVYEDRVKHVSGFRNFFTDYNKRQEGYGGQKTRGPITAEVIQVAEISTFLDPVVEVAEIQHLINSHNALLRQKPSQKGGRGQGPLMIKKTVFFTSYMVGKEDTKKLLKLANFPTGNDLKVHGNNIMICPRPCPQSILEKVGGMGAKMKWKVTGTGCFENSIWAASVEPVPATAKYHTDNPSPLVVLAIRKGARPMDAGKIQNWQPVPPEKAYILETHVGEKVLLRIEPEDPSENAYESLFANKASKRKHTGDDHDGHHPRPRDGSGNFANSRGDRGSHNGRGGNHQARGGGFNRGNGNNTPSRGYRSGPRGGGHHKGGGRGGRGGGHNYKSLDDVGNRDSQVYGGANSGVSYDDSFPSLSSGNSNFQSNQSQPPSASYNPYQSNSQQQGASGRPAGASGGFGNGAVDLQNLY